MFLDDKNSQLLEDHELQIMFCREHARLRRQQAKLILAIATDTSEGSVICETPIDDATPAAHQRLPIEVTRLNS